MNINLVMTCQTLWTKTLEQSQTKRDLLDSAIGKSFKLIYEIVKKYKKSKFQLQRRPRNNIHNVYITFH